MYVSYMCVLFVTNSNEGMGKICQSIKSFLQNFSEVSVTLTTVSDSGGC